MDYAFNREFFNAEMFNPDDQIRFSSMYYEPFPIEVTRCTSLSVLFCVMTVECNCMGER